MLIVLAFWSFLHAHPRAAQANVTQSRLQNDYALFNGAWFGGKLPDDTSVVYDQVPDGRDVVGLTNWDGTRFVIYIVPRYNLAQSTADETVLHEMCHVFTWNREVIDHGPRFQQCMLDLADDGALAHIW